MSATPIYDGNFNLYNYGGWGYLHDADGRLTTANGPGHSATFVYDGLGRCVKRTIDGLVTLLTYDGWKPIVEWDAAGNRTAFNVYGLGADEILVRWGATTGYMKYHLDRMGSVQFILDASNNGLEKYTYDVFGQPKITNWAGTPLTDSAFGNRFMFTGREYLTTLGIYDYRHRFYHPGLGRFLEMDPTNFKAGDPNLFRYCHHNPVNRGDSSGLTDNPYGGPFYNGPQDNQYWSSQALNQYYSSFPSYYLSPDAIAAYNYGVGVYNASLPVLNNPMFRYTAGFVKIYSGTHELELSFGALAIPYVGEFVAVGLAAVGSLEIQHGTEDIMGALEGQGYHFQEASPYDPASTGADDSDSSDLDDEDDSASTQILFLTFRPSGSSPSGIHLTLLAERLLAVEVLVICLIH